MTSTNKNHTKSDQFHVQIPILSNATGDATQPQQLNTNAHMHNPHNGIDMDQLNLSPNKCNQLIKLAKEAFATGRTRNAKFRKQQLIQLKKLCDENKPALCDALKADLNKPPFETMLCEYNLVVNEIIELMSEVEDWAKPQSRGAGTMLFMFDKSYVQYEPLGTVLVMGAWNYPLLLSLQPLIGAIAAGNCAVLKMSEHAPNVGKVLAQLVPQYLDTECYQVINCDITTTKYLLAEHKFDHIFYTGGENGGKAVYTAASKTLTPIVLELGGKSPVYIDDDVSEREAVWNRLFWGKFLNAGQTCVAPDYVLCSEKAQQQARKHFHKILNQFYNGDPTNSENYVRIVNYQHFERLKKLLKESRMVVGGKLNKDKLTIEPAIVLDVTLDDPVMQEEIFGPILPFVTCSSPQKAIDIINSRPKPLALYLFSDSRKLQDKFLKQTSSGGVCINDTILHLSSLTLPFGGVGSSGFGKYHGKSSLQTFSNERAVLSRSFNPLLEYLGSHRYPPYSDFKLILLSQLGLNRKVPLPGLGFLTNVVTFGTGVASVFAYQYFTTM